MTVWLKGGCFVPQENPKKVFQLGTTAEAEVGISMSYQEIKKDFQSSALKSRFDSQLSR